MELPYHHSLTSYAIFNIKPKIHVSGIFQTHENLYREDSSSHTQSLVSGEEWVEIDTFGS